MSKINARSTIKQKIEFLSLNREHWSDLEYLANLMHLRGMYSSNTCKSDIITAIRRLLLKNFNVRSNLEEERFR